MGNTGKFFFGAGLGCSLMIGLAFFGLILLAMVTPSDEAVPGKSMADSDLEMLRELEILAADERIIYFYSPGVFDISEGGSFFTDRRVVAYVQSDGNDTLEQATYADIANIDVVYSEDWLEDSLIVATRHDGTEILLSITNTERSDRRFFNRLLREWKEKGGNLAVGPEETTQ